MPARPIWSSRLWRSQRGTRRPDRRPTAKPPPRSGSDSPLRRVRLLAAPASRDSRREYTDTQNRETPGVYCLRLNSKIKRLVTARGWVSLPCRTFPSAWTEVGQQSAWPHVRTVSSPAEQSLLRAARGHAPSLFPSLAAPASSPGGGRAHQRKVPYVPPQRGGRGRRSGESRQPRWLPLLATIRHAPVGSQVAPNVAPAARGADQGKGTRGSHIPPSLKLLAPL